MSNWDFLNKNIFISAFVIVILATFAAGALSGCAHVQPLGPNPPCSTGETITDKVDMLSAATCEGWGEAFGHDWETVWVLFLDEGNHVHKTLTITGSVRKVTLNLVHLEHEIQDTQARRLVVYHNHTIFAPRLEFSEADLQTLTDIQLIARRNGGDVIDFVVIAPDRMLSARAKKYL